MLSPFGHPLDLNEFVDVPEPCPHAQALRLSFSKSDQLTQNGALRKALNGTSAFRMRISPDSRTLILDPEGPSNMTFTAAGVRTHRPLGTLLRQQGLEPPLSFLVVWAEELHCWIAQYDGLTSPPDSLTAKNPAKPRRGRNR